MIEEIIYSLLLLLSILILRRLFKRLLNKKAAQKNASEHRTYYIHKMFDILVFFTTAISLIFIWSVDLKGISLIASSVFAVVGVALFAQWSILSNITSSIIIFFNFPARIGDRIRIVDGDNSIEGMIKEITLFQMEIIDDKNQTILYPNNLILQKPVIKLV